jgi:hypothetical protein
MTPGEVVMLHNHGGLTFAEMGYLEFVRWLYRRGRISEGRPGEPLNVPEYDATDETVYNHLPQIRRANRIGYADS